MNNFRLIFYSIIGGVSIAGTFITDLLGGWNSTLETLIIFMALDYLTGLICSLIFKKSNKSDTGAYDSKIGLKGLFKKVGILFMILIAARLDLIMNWGQNGYICKTVTFFFITNEGLSIVENLGLMGLPLPNVIKDAFCKLKSYENDKTK